MARHLQLALVFVGMWVVGSDDDDDDDDDDDGGVIEERYYANRWNIISLCLVN